MQAFRWTREHVAAIGRTPYPMAPAIAPHEVPRIASDLDIWDHWPALTPDGALAMVEDGLLVVALSSPIFDDPEQRHAHARLRLFHRNAERWRDLGSLLPDGLSPGSREWAGSAVLDGRNLALYFTAAGSRGEPEIGFEQRLFACDIDLGPDLRPAGWSKPVELVRPDGRTYQTDMAGGGAVGTIKAFRDPFVFCDPDTRLDRVLFAASRAGARSAWNGLVGVAERDGDRWTLAEPWVDAVGINNELERPHLIFHRGRPHLFWSTQRKVFAPELRHAPTGLYGVVAERLGAPWRPINGDGLVFANPDSAPAQAYSWQVLPDLTVWSFADAVGSGVPPSSPAEARRHFAGAPAPVLHLALEGDRAWLT